MAPQHIEEIKEEKTQEIVVEPKKEKNEMAPNPIEGTNY